MLLTQIVSFIYSFVAVHLMFMTIFSIKKDLIISYIIKIKKLIIRPTNKEKLVNKEELAGVKRSSDAKGLGNREKLILICHNHQY